LRKAAAAEASGFTFLQISDSHIGFHLPSNPNALGTLYGPYNSNRNHFERDIFRGERIEFSRLRRLSFELCEFISAPIQKTGNKTQRF